MSYKTSTYDKVPETGSVISWYSLEHEQVIQIALYIAEFHSEKV